MFFVIIQPVLTVGEARAEGAFTEIKRYPTAGRRPSNLTLKEPLF